MNKIDLCAAAMIAAILRGENDRILVLVPNVGAGANIRQAVLTASTRANLKYNVKPGGLRIEFEQGFVQIETLQDFGSTDKPQTFDRHEDGARAIVALAKEHPNLYAAVILPHSRLHTYIGGHICDEASRAGLQFKPKKMERKIVFGNGAIIYFVDADRPRDLEGRRFNAAWSVAPQIWKGREISTVLEDRCTAPVPGGMIESYD